MCSASPVCPCTEMNRRKSWLRDNNERCMANQNATHVWYGYLNPKSPLVSDRMPRIMHITLQWSSTSGMKKLKAHIFVYFLTWFLIDQQLCADDRIIWNFLRPDLIKIISNLQEIVPSAFLERNIWYFYSKFNELCVGGSTSQKVTIGLSDGFAGLDTNGCPLGNSKFTLMSDNLNICLWLSACQVGKIYQNQIQIDTYVHNSIRDLDIIYDCYQFNQNCFGSFFKTKLFCSRAIFAPALMAVKSLFLQLATTLSGDSTITLGIVCKALFSCWFPKHKMIKLPGYILPMFSLMQNTFDDQAGFNDLHKLKSTFWFVFQANWENQHNCMYQEILITVFSLWMGNMSVTCLGTDWGDQRWLLW